MVLDSGFFEGNKVRRAVLGGSATLALEKVRVVYSYEREGGRLVYESTCLLAPVFFNSVIYFQLRQVRMNFSCGGKNSSLSSGAMSGNDVGTGAPWVLQVYFLLIDHRRKPKWDDGIFNGNAGEFGYPSSFSFLLRAFFFSYIRIP